MVKLTEATPKIGAEGKRIEDIVDVQQFPNGKWIQLRLLDSDLLPIRIHWIDIISSVQKKQVRIPKICVAFDPTTGKDKKGVKCPYCSVNEPAEMYLANAIIRTLQEDKPRKAKKPTSAEKESGFKDISSSSWTPVKVVRFTANTLSKIQGLKDLNKHKGEKYSVSHAKYGADINVKYNEKGTGADKYQVNLGDKSALTDEEKNYLIYELTDAIVQEMGRETVKQAEIQLKRMEIYNEDDDDKDKNKKKSRKVKDSSDESDMDDKNSDSSDSSEEESSESEVSDSDKPKKGKKKSKKESDESEVSDSDKPKKGKKKSKKESDESEEESNSDSESSYDSDADVDSDSDKPKKGKKKSKKESDESEKSDSDTSDISDSDSKKKGKKSKDRSDDSESESDKKQKGGKRKSKKSSDNSDDESDSNKKKKNKKKRKSSSDTSDSDNIPF